MPEISVIVEAGKATAAAPLGPALGPLGLNIGKVVAEINEKTKQFIGLKIPIKISVDSQKNFEIKVGSPSTSELIKKEIGIKKADAKLKEENTISVSMQQLINVAKMKQEQLSSYTLKNSVKELIGTCVSMGLKVEGKEPKEILKKIDKGKYDSQFK